MTNTHQEAPRLVLLSGASCAGKTTYRDMLCQADPNAVALSRDDLLEEWAKAEGLSYQDAYERFGERAKDILFAQCDAAVAAGQNIIWDQTNLTPEIRAEILARVPDHYMRVAIAFEPPLSMLLQRAWDREQETGKHMPTHVISTQHNGYQRPHFDEGFDSVYLHSVETGAVARIS